MARPTHASSGHGHFVEPDSDIIYFQGDPYTGMATPHPGDIKFTGDFLPPFLQMESTSNNTFTVGGAWYSMLYEAAKKINFTLIGVSPKSDMTEEEYWQQLFDFRPDVSLVPITAQTDAVLTSIDLGRIQLSRTVTVFEMDHILSAKKFKTKSLLSMVTPFDFTSFILTVTALACIAFFARNFKLKVSKITFREVIWNLATALICSPQVTAKKAIWRFVGLTWALGVFLLQQIFSGEMFQAMTLSAGLDVVDNFEELATRDRNPISATDTFGADINRYFSPDREHREELSARIRILSPREILYGSLLEEVLENVSKSRQFHLAPLHHLEQYVDRFEVLLGDNLYIPKEFGQFMPVSFMYKVLIETIIAETLDLMISRMQESGIYQNWVNSYTAKRVKRSNEILAYKAAELKHFQGLFVISSGFMFLAFLTLILEIMGKKGESLHKRTYPY